MNARALVLCAGRGSRLGALAAATPKPLLPAHGRPLLEWILLHLRACGVSEVAVNLHTGAERFPAALGDGSALGAGSARGPGLAIRWRHEEALLGTAGSLRRAGPWLAERGAFLVCYGDVVTDHPLAALLDDLAAHPGALATLLVHRRASNSALAVAADGTVTAFLERPDAAARAAHGLAGETWVNSGVCACHPDLLACIPPADPCDLARDVLAPLAGCGRLRALPLAGYRTAVDSPERLARLDADLAAGRVAISPAR